MHYPVISFPSTTACLNTNFSVALWNNNDNTPETYNQFKPHMFCNSNVIFEISCNDSRIVSWTNSFFVAKRCDERLNTLQHHGISCHKPCLIWILLDHYWLTLMAIYMSNALNNLDSKNNPGEFNYFAKSFIVFLLRVCLSSLKLTVYIFRSNQPPKFFRF